MTKIVFAIIGLTLVMGVVHSNLLNILPIVVHLSEDFQEVEVGILGSSVGIMAVPFNTICRVPLLYDYFTCFLCNQDCIYAHNTFGGRCDEDPMNPGLLTCLCAETQEDAVSRNISRSSGEMCKWITPSALEIDIVGSLVDTTFVPIVKTRTAALQCPQYSDGSFESSGCVTDCTANHGTLNGTCTFTAPKITALGTSPALYCECN